MDTLKSFDFYPKVADEARVKTFSGAAISLIAATLMSILFLSQLFDYLTIRTTDHLIVDIERGQDLQVNFDIYFPHLPCTLLSADIIDVANRRLTDIKASMYKQVLHEDGSLGERFSYSLGVDTPLYGSDVYTGPYDRDACGKCGTKTLGATECCSTCADVKTSQMRSNNQLVTNFHDYPQCAREYLHDMWERIGRKEGCRFYGHYFTKRVAGQLRILPGRNAQLHAHIKQVLQSSTNIQDITYTQLDLTHTMKVLSFGEIEDGFVAPLNGVTKIDTDNVPTMFLYYNKVVPTTVLKLNKQSVHSNQYSVTEHVKYVEVEGLHQSSPGLYFAYEHSPIRVQKVQERMAFLTFLTQVCAIVGGVFAVAGVFDRIIYSSAQHKAAKIELGKVN